ncbi:hypothetical protein BAC2_03726 [uncultured bacterium]|nr:hypothetical protein BAC2_03726 [uncultured bacterium]
MTVGEAVTLIGALAILIGALSTYRSAMRKADIDALQRRMLDAEKRQAQADERAATYEHRANEYRTDVIQLGEELAKERCENKKRLEELKQASEHQIDDLKRQSQITINKLVVIIESMWKQLKSAGLEPDFDLEDLKKMYVVEKAEEVG